MPLEDWSYRVEQRAAEGDGKARAVFQTVTVLWYKGVQVRGLAGFDWCSAFFAVRAKRASWPYHGAAELWPASGRRN
jgi:hypothetical protein